MGTCERQQSGGMSLTLTKQFVASSFALRSVCVCEVSLDILTYSCHCLKIHGSVLNAVLDWVSVQSVGGHQPEPWSNTKISPVLLTELPQKFFPECFTQT